MTPGMPRARVRQGQGRAKEQEEEMGIIPIPALLRVICALLLGVYRTFPSGAAGQMEVAGVEPYWPFIRVSTRVVNSLQFRGIRWTPVDRVNVRGHNNADSSAHTEDAGGRFKSYPRPETSIQRQACALSLLSGPVRLAVRKGQRPSRAASASGTCSVSSCPQELV